MSAHCIPSDHTDVSADLGASASLGLGHSRPQSLLQRMRTMDNMTLTAGVPAALVEVVGARVGLMAEDAQFRTEVDHQQAPLKASQNLSYVEWKCAKHVSYMPDDEDLEVVPDTPSPARGRKRNRSPPRHRSRSLAKRSRRDRSMSY